MKPISFFAAILLTTVTIFSYAGDFTTDDEDLEYLSKPIDTAIRSSKGFKYKSCKFLGKPIDLLGQGAESGYVVIPDSACDQGGAAHSQIWVVRDGAHPTVVLTHRGHALTLERQMQNGLRDIEIYAVTDGWATESLWKFDGVAYVKVKERRFQ
jgi:hypothetical protein